MPETQSREFYLILRKIKGFYKEYYSQEKEERHSFLKITQKKKVLYNASAPPLATNAVNQRGWESGSF